MQQIYENITDNILVPGTLYEDVFMDLAHTVADYEKTSNLLVIYSSDMRLILALMLAHDNCTPVARAIMSAISAIDTQYPGRIPLDDENPRKINGLRVVKNVGGVCDQAVVVLEDTAPTDSADKVDIPLLTNVEVDSSSDDPTNRISYLDTIVSELSYFREEQRRENKRIKFLAIWIPIVSVAAYALGELIGTML